MIYPQATTRSPGLNPLFGGFGLGGSGSGPPPVTLGLAQWTAPRRMALADGAAVATSTDWTGNGNHFAQATAANRPTYDADGINGVAGELYVPDGANSSWMQCDAAAQSFFGGTLKEWGWMAVVKHLSLGAAHQTVLMAAQDAGASGVPTADVFRNGDTGTYNFARRDDAGNLTYGSRSTVYPEP